MLSAQCVARNVRHCGRKGWRVPEWWEYPSCLKGRPGATRQADAHSVAKPTIEYAVVNQSVCAMQNARRLDCPVLAGVAD